MPWPEVGDTELLGKIRPSVARKEESGSRWAQRMKDAADSKSGEEARDFVVWCAFLRNSFWYGVENGQERPSLWPGRTVRQLKQEYYGSRQDKGVAVETELNRDTCWKENQQDFGVESKGGVSKVILLLVWASMQVCCYLLVSDWISSVLQLMTLEGLADTQRQMSARQRMLTNI